MTPDILLQAQRSIDNAASSKIITITDDGRYIDQHLESYSDFQKTLYAYDILKQFWPIAPILSSNSQKLHLRMPFCGLPIRHFSSHVFYQAVSLLMKEQIGIVSTRFDTNLVIFELDLFYDWFMAQKLKVESKEHYDDFKELFVSFFNQAPSRIVHRDYHSENILYRAESGIAIIDYQDLVMGPYLYDFVSLMEDAYQDTSAYSHKALEQYYHWAQKLVDSPMEDYRVCAMQRIIKMVGIFSRLSLRDGKVRYEQYIPKLLKRLIELADNRSQKLFFQRLLELNNR